jgi:hypothetical protein
MSKDCVYIIIDSDNFCPRSLMIPVEVIEEYKNLRDCLDILLKACEEKESALFVYKMMPYIKVSNNCWMSDPNPTEAEKIVKCLHYYGDDTPSKWFLYDECDSEVDVGLPPLHVNGWFKHVAIDYYRRSNKSEKILDKNGEWVDVNIVKTIHAQQQD